MRSEQLSLIQKQALFIVVDVLNALKERFST